MKAFILLSLFALAAAEDYYVTGHDDLDVNKLVSNLATLKSFVDCFLDRAPCSEVMASFKKIIPDSLETGCRKCNSALKHQAHGFYEGLKKTLPQEYMNLKQHYDPENKYFDEYEKLFSSF